MGLDAMSAHGTIISRRPAAGGSFTAVGELRDITGPELMRNAIETSSHNDGDATFVVGIRRKGELSFEIGFNQSLTSHDGLRDSWQAGDRDTWLIDFVDGTDWVFSGYVTNLGPAMPVDDGFTASVTIQPTGGHIFTPA